MAYSLVQKQPTDLTATIVGPGATSVSITFSSTPAANNLILASAAFYDSTGSDTIAFSDNKGNTWAADKFAYDGNASKIVVGSIGSAIAVTATSTFTVTATISGGSGYLDTSIQEFSGGSTSVGAHLGNTNSGSNVGTSFNSGAASPTTGSELFYAAGCNSNNATVTSSWSGATVLTNSVASVGLFAAYKESVQSETATATFSNNAWWAVIATYKAGGAAAATSLPPMRPFGAPTFSDVKL